MRIIAGTLKGRRLDAPRGSAVRPTSDSLRETLFNVLDDLVVGARVIDGYAGTGAIGLEAISRGAAHVTFIEREAAVLRVLRANAAALGVENACTIVRADFAATHPAVDRSRFDLVVIDPPYDLAGYDAALAASATRLTPSGWLVVEHRARGVSLPEFPPGLRRVRVMTAGDSALTFFVARADEAQA